MSVTIQLSAEAERQLRAEAARVGRAPEEFARAVLEERLAAPQHGPGEGLAALLDQWLGEPPDLDEADVYPEQIEPLRLREVSIR